MSTARAVRVGRRSWASDERLWRGVLEGRRIGTGVTVLFYATDEIGRGPTWHVHEYDELFIVRVGRARFTIGDTRIEATAGDILLGPAGIPHKYENLGPGLLETIDVHLSERWKQTDLRDPELEERSESAVLPSVVDVERRRCSDEVVDARDASAVEGGRARGARSSARGSPSQASR